MRYVSLTEHSLDKLRNDYVKEHSKFIHSSYLLLEDLDKEVVIDGKKFRIAGLWDIIGYRKIILMQAQNGTHCYLDSKEIAAALGFTTFRNFVTGKPITYDIAAQKSYNDMINKAKVDIFVPEPDVTVDEDRIVEDEIIEKEPVDDIDAPVMERDDEYVSENEVEDDDDVDDKFVVDTNRYSEESDED